MLLTVMAAMALSLSSIPVLQQAAHAEGMVSDTKAAAEGTAKSLEGIASDTKEATTKSLQGAVSDTKEAVKGTGKSFMDKAGKVKTDANKTKDSAKSLDLMGTTQGAGQTKQDLKDLKDSATDMMKNPFGK
jgi:hypothetical protein